MAKVGKTPEARRLAAEHQQQVIMLRIRGLSFSEIGRQVGVTKQASFLLYKKALKLIPKADLEELRKLEAERIVDLRKRVWADLAGKQDPSDPAKIIRPEGQTLATLVNAANRLSRHEAMVFGLDAPTKTEAMVGALSGQAISDEELDIRLARLTPDERTEFMRLTAKMEERWVEPPAIDDQGVTVETTTTAVQPNGAAT